MAAARAGRRRAQPIASCPGLVVSSARASATSDARRTAGATLLGCSRARSPPRRKLERKRLLACLTSARLPPCRAVDERDGARADGCCGGRRCSRRSVVSTSTICRGSRPARGLVAGPALLVLGFALRQGPRWCLAVLMRGRHLPAPTRSVDRSVRSTTAHRHPLRRAGRVNTRALPSGGTAAPTASGLARCWPVADRRWRARSIRSPCDARLRDEPRCRLAAIGTNAQPGAMARAVRAAQATRPGGRDRRHRVGRSRSRSVVPRSTGIIHGSGARFRLSGGVGANTTGLLAALLLVMSFHGPVPAGDGCVLVVGVTGLVHQRSLWAASRPRPSR